MMNFAGKVVIVTGASSGIGSSTAVFLSKLGAQLSLTGRNIENLQKVSNDCKKSTATFSIAADLTKENDIEKIIKTTVDHYGQLDVLVNNAGIIETGTIENTSLAQFDRLMNTNVRSIYYLTMLAVPHLIQSKGNIVNVSSVNGIRSFPGVLAYNMSKISVDQFTRCVALELASKGVRVNCVNPGFIMTELHKRGGLSDEQYAAFKERCKETHPLGRAGIVGEVAAAISFLASDFASNITGVSLPVDGGRHAVCPR